jgi:hypothetical protein
VALGFSSRDRLERILRNVPSAISISEGDKVQALQNAAIFYGLYAGDGSETTYTDKPGLLPMEAELIAVVAAIDLVNWIIISSTNNVQSTTAGPVSVTFRSDTLNWLQAFLKALLDKKKLLEDKNSLGEDGAVELPGLFISKVGACCDPSDNPCVDSYSTDDPSKA